MGIESWYLNIKLKRKIDVSDLSIVSYEFKNGVYILSISYSYLSFFESVKYIYDWITRHFDLIIECDTDNKSIIFSNGFILFLSQLYELNENKINFFYNQVGTFMIASGKDTYNFLKKIEKILLNGIHNIHNLFSAVIEFKNDRVIILFKNGIIYPFLGR